MSAAAARRADAADARPGSCETVRVPGGTFRMGSDRHYPEERPAHDVRVDGFRIDRTPVTNRAFARFADATGYRTVAELPPDPALYPGADLAMLKPGALVFREPAGRVDMRLWGDWWHYVAGASWRRPDGRSDLDRDRLDHPVVHIAHADAEAYAAWAGKSLPTEAEWEFAARGGLAANEYAWGADFAPGGRRMANTWAGDFPRRGPAAAGDFGTSAVASYPPNGYGLHDMIGNVWEWTADDWRDGHAAAAPGCCAPANPRVADPAGSVDPRLAGIGIPRKVLKGGSHLCAPNYCRRYRPAARSPQAVDSAATNVGFRCVLRDASAIEAAAASQPGAGE